MALRVEIQPQAYDDLDSIADYIKSRSSFSTAEKWFNGIMDDIASLKEMPERCAIAPESVDLDGEGSCPISGPESSFFSFGSNFLMRPPSAVPDPEAENSACQHF